jgi:type II secretory pathway component PulF
MYSDYNYDYYGTTDLIYNLNESTIWVIISLVLAIVGAFIIYFLFVKPEKKYDNKFLNWLRRFLNFKEVLIEPILKIAYIFLALFITLYSFAKISSSFTSFLITLIFGNLLLRVIYELCMIIIGIWQNTRDINKKMK